MAGILGSGIGFPLAVDGHGGLTLAHGEEDVEQAIPLILGTAPGERPMRPEFGCGVHDYIFEAVDAYTLGRLEHEIREALERWEPRIEVLGVDFDLARAEHGELLIDIAYRLRATNDVRNLIYPFYVIPEEESE
ncbi:MAG: GPW/gp25 family protein [Solirubrobacterales bacterium]